MNIWNPKAKTWEENNNIWNPRKKKWETPGVTTKKNTSTPKSKETPKDTYFKKGAFTGDYDWGRDGLMQLGYEALETGASTVADIGVGVLKGALSTVEGIKDLGQYGIAAMGDVLGADEFAKKQRAKAQRSDMDIMFGGIQKHLDQYSLLGAKSKAVPEALGNIGTMMLTGIAGNAAGLGKVGVTALTTGVTGTSSMGSGMSEAYSEGATDKEAVVYGTIKGAADAGTELIFGALGKTVNATGISTGLSSADDMLAKKISSKISNQLLKNGVEASVKAGAEGTEEVLAGVISAIGKKVTYMDEEELSKIIQDEKLLDQFIVGAVSSGIVQSGYIPGTSQGSVKEANQTGRDYITGLTQSEQKVVDAEIKKRISEAENEGKRLSNKEKAKIQEQVRIDLEKGYIDIDTIESTLGGKIYDSYQNLSKEMEEYQSLNKMKAMELTGEQSDRLTELKEKNKKASYESEQARLKEQLSKEVSDMTVNDRFLRESYNEKGRRSQAFEADVKTYDEKQRSIIQNAIDSGILNNTRRTHEFVDMIAKISADKGVSFDFTDNKRLKESGFAKEGISINGYIKDGNVTLNVNSAKALNKVVGHEITHVLEGSDLYAELQEVVKAYATTKGEYNSKLEAITKLYEGVEGANVEQELTADLIGEYLFTDEAFVQQLSAQNRNVFQKIYDEIKYLCKVVSSGSKEAKQLEKVKRAFDKAYKETAKDTNNRNKVQYDISEDTELYQYIQDSLNGKLSKKSSYDLSDSISERLAKDIESILGFSIEGYRNQISPGNIEHINKEHGIDGRSDKSMSDLHDLAKIRYVIENYDNLREGKVSRQYKNSDGSLAKTIELQKKIDDKFYYVVEAVPDAKSKSLHVVSAYINKNDTFSEVAVSEDPSRYVQDELQTNVSSNNSISQNQQKTTENEKFSLSEDSNGKQLSEMQIEYFKDSKVRSTDGKLLEVYHGTNSNQFTVFDSSKSDKKVRLNVLGNGFYFAPNKDKAEKYGQRVINVYLDMKNPYRFNGRTGGILAQLEEDFGVSADNTKRSEIQEILKKNGFDGVLMYQSKYDEPSDFITAVVFNANQIKNVDNQNPTENEDIRYQLSNDDIAPTDKWNVKGSDIVLDDSTPIRKDISPAQKEKAQQVPEEWEPYESDDLTDGPFNMDDEESTPENEEAIQFKEANKRKVKNIQAKIQGLQVSKDVTKKEFSESIAKKKEEYERLKRKDTAKASKLLEQITNLEYRRDNTIAELDRKIEGQRKAMENIKKQEVARQRKRKQNELQNRVRELIGDTSTWKDKKNGISYQVNTLRRNLRDVVRDADGNRDIAKADEIYEALQGKYNINEAELNREANRIKKEFADLKINATENTYIQMLGEYRHNPDTTISAEVIGEYYEKHKSKIDNAKVDKAIETARKLYDSLFYRVNSVLREQGMQEIGYREGYFPHFTEEKQGVLGKIFNWKTQNNDIPTDIAGLTEQFNPNRSWQSFNKHRTGDDTDYNFMKGLDSYVNGALDWIYHIEDIQMRRALENEIRYRHSEKGIQEKIDAIYSNPFYDADEAQAEIDKILKEAKNPLNNFVTDLRKGTNVLAGKKDSGDRYIEEKTSRKIYSTMTNISNRVTANMVAGSVSSALTNFIPITQSWGQVSPVSSVIGMAETIKSYVVDDGTVNKSNFLTNRLRKNENLYQTGWDKAGNAIGFMMEAVDDFTSQTVWRSKYMENIKNGMSEEAAIKDADQFAENVIAGRSRGNMPTIFNEKNLITKMFTAFQLEVGNQYGYMLKDMPQDMRNENKGKLVKGYVSMFVGAYAYNALFSKLTGRDAAFDPFRILQELLGDLFGDDEEEGSITDAITNLATNIVEETPFIGGLVGGGRIPISSALPYEGLSVETLTGVMNDLSEGNMKNFWQEILKPVYYVAMPMGGGQTRKTIQGLQMFDDDLPIAGSYTNSGKLRFSVDDDIPTRIQAAVFGQYANKNAREYFDEGRTPLSEKKTKELVDLDIPISEYWDIQDGLKEHEKLADKIDYVAELDLPIAKKNILANNLTTRKEPIDLTDYDLYGNIEELDFATSEPEKYKVAKAVGGYSSYKTYTKELNNIKANKGKNGKAISGSRKTKVVNYLNGLSADYGTKLILFKKEFPGDDTYNKAIVEYLNKRNDLSYSDVETILKELGFTVDSKGNVRW